MTEKLSNFGSETSDNSSPYDTLAEMPDFETALRAAKQEIKDAAPGRAAGFYHNVRDIQLDFARRNQTLAGEDSKMSEKEFLRWEEAAADELKLAADEEKRGGLTLNQEAEAKDEMVTYRVDTELHKTIEAQAANFYSERDAALRTAIRASDSEDKAKDLAYLNGFYASVAEHLDFKYMTPSDVQDYGPNEYERNRTRAHNETIRHLNGINDLARKYDTRPFTVRNFWTSDLRDRRGQTPAMARVMRYDRDIVEEYYAIAFGDEVKKRENKMRRELSYGF